LMSSEEIWVVPIEEDKPVIERAHKKILIIRQHNSVI
jgi:hypothetical protein